jgi:hypothetical protein
MAERFSTGKTIVTADGRVKSLGQGSVVLDRYAAADSALGQALHGNTFVVWDKWGGFLRNLYAGQIPIHSATPDVVISKIGPWSEDRIKKVFSHERETGSLAPQIAYDEQLREEADEYLKRIGRPLAIAGWTQRSIHSDFLERHGGRFLGPPPELRRTLENKYTFNDLLDEVGIPPQRQLRHGLFASSDALPLYTTLASRYGSTFVIQTDTSQGGKGTEIVSDSLEFASAKERLSGKLRVSEFRDQQYSTAYLLSVPKADGDVDVYVDIPSYKTTSIPELNINSVTGAGGDWTLPYPENFPAAEYVENLVRIGKHLYRKYRFAGHWNVEGFLSQDGFDMNELNCRPGGGTEVSGINQDLRGVPAFILAHLIHWAGGRVEYMPSADEFNQNTIKEIERRSVNKPFYLKVFGQYRQKLGDHVQGSGVYKLDNGSLHWLRDGVATTDANFDDGEVLLAHLPQPLSVCAPKAQICTIEGVTSTGHIFSGQHELSPEGLIMANATNSLFEKIS